MKQKKLFLMMLCFSAIYVKAQHPLSDPSWNTTPVFSDEFNYSGVPETTKWLIWNKYDHGGEVECYTNRSSNILVDGAYLQLKLTQESYTVTPGSIDQYGNSSSGTYNYTSGGMEGKYTTSSNNFKYGYMEARANIPYTADSWLWPAFWTAVVPGTTPVSSVAEIDIFEQLENSLQDQYTLGANQVFSYGSLVPPDGSSACNTGTVKDDAPAPLPSSYSGWHTYAAEWSPTTVTWYFDGIPVKRYKNAAKGAITDYCYYAPGDGSSGHGGGQHDPVRIILNLAVQGGVAPNAILYIDYVRVYQLKNDCDPTTGNVVNVTSGTCNLSAYDNKVKKSISIGGTGVTTTYASTPNISLKAAQDITLGEGFSTPSDATSIYIDVTGCPQ